MVVEGGAEGGVVDGPVDDGEIVVGVESEDVGSGECGESGGCGGGAEVGDADDGELA